MNKAIHQTSSFYRQHVNKKRGKRVRKSRLPTYKEHDLVVQGEEVIAEASIKEASTVASFRANINKIHLDIKEAKVSSMKD